MAIKVGGTTVVDDSRNICSVATVNATTVCATTLKGEGANITGIAGTVPVGGILLSTTQPCNYVKADGAIYVKTSQPCLSSVIGDRVDFQSATIQPKRPVNINGYIYTEMCQWGTSTAGDSNYANRVAAHYTKWNCCNETATYLCTCDNIPYRIYLGYKCGNACSVYSTTCNSTFNSQYSLGSGNYRMNCSPGYGFAPVCNKVFVFGSRDNGGSATFHDYGMWDSSTCCLSVPLQCCRCDNIGTYERNNAYGHLRGGYLQSKPNNPFWVHLYCNCGQNTTPCRYWMAIASNTSLAWSGVTLGLNECVVGDASDNYAVGNVLCNLVSFGYDTLLLGGQGYCQSIVKFFSGNTTPCYCCTVITDTCRFDAHGYNGNSCVFVGLRCNNLVYSPDGITWTTACCCTCLSFTGSKFLTTKDNKTILYGDFNRSYGTAGNVNILYSCNGCNWQLLTKCIGRSATVGPMHEIPGSNLIGNHNILVDNNFSCINLVHPWEMGSSGCCTYCGHGRCVAYVYGLQCYISLPCSSTTCGGGTAISSIYGSANGDGWCYIGEVPRSGQGDTYKIQQYQCKIIGVSHYFVNSNVALLCANLGTTPLSFTCVDTKIKPCEHFRFNGGPIQIFSNKTGSSVGFAIACNCDCCVYRLQPLYRTLANSLIHYTKDFGTTICCITNQYNNCVWQCSIALGESKFVPNLYNYGNVISMYKQVCGGGGEAPVTYYAVTDSVHYCFTSTGDLTYIGCTCGCTYCASDGICCTSLSLPVVGTSGAIYYMKSALAPSTSGWSNATVHYDECTDLHYTYVSNNCCTIIASTKNGTWTYNSATIGCISPTSSLTTNAAYCCWPNISRYTSLGACCNFINTPFANGSGDQRVAFSVDCLNRFATNYGAMCACFDTTLCFVVPNIELSSVLSTYMRAS
jgi:hypothetical protein